MDKLIEQIIDETFKSKKQQRYFFWKAKKSKKWKDMAKEFASKTDFSKLPEKAQEEQVTSNPVTGENDYLKHAGELNGGPAVKSEIEVDEIVDANGDIKYGDTPGNPNAYVRSKKTSDEVVSATMGQMGTFGILGGPTNANKTLKYWAESDMSKALGADETIANPEVDYDDAVDYFEDDLEVPEDEAKERVKKFGYDPELPDGKMRLIENPLEYIKEYLAKKTKNRELVKKIENESEKKQITPIIRRQLQSIKQTLKDNDLTLQDITEYLEDNE
jgi:hypothetical protein